MIIDSHQHFWRLETGFYDWIPPADAILRRNFEWAELAPQLQDAGVGGTILVQAANTEEELSELSQQARKSGFVLGIVAPLEIGRAGAAERISAMTATPLLVGFRPPFAQMFDADGEISDSANVALGALDRDRLALDCLAVGNALALIPNLALRFENLIVVVDHGGNPNLAAGRVSPEWRQNMTAIASCPNAVCKLSGLLTRLPAAVDRTIVAEHVSILVDLFGPSRLLWGSDWPVLTKAASYQDWLLYAQTLLAPLSETERAAVMGGNAARAYRLGNGSDVTA